MSRLSGQRDRIRMGRRARLFPSAVRLAAFSVLWSSLSCTSSQTSVTSPSTPRCGVTVTNSMETAPASGGAGTVTVAATRDCTWAASTAVSWVVITSSSSGQGEGSVSYRVATNTEPAIRRATIEVNNTAATIVQQAAECRFAVTPTTAAVESPGGTVTIQVQTHAACSWTATSEAGWIRVASGSEGTGDGAVSLAVGVNSGNGRTGRVVVAGVAVTVNQNGVASPPPPAPAPGCSYSIQPVGQTIAASGGTGTVDVTASAGTCAWTAASNAPWISITAGASTTGNGRVTFAAAANTGASRTGTISVAGHTFTLTQAGASCSYSINPGSEAMAAAGGTSTVTVSAGPSCAWTSASNDSWISIVSGATGTGPGSVTLTVAANQGPARTGSATIAAQTFTVTQAAAPCAYGISPTSQTVAAGGGAGSVNVTAAAGCGWTATSNNADWLTITSTPSGSGDGSVSFSVSANTGAQRVGTLTVAGQTFTVTQQAPCAFSIAPLSQAMGAAGGSGTITVTTGDSCSWSATSSSPEWLTVTGGSSGVGSGQIAFSAAANAGAERTGTIAVGGLTFTLTQSGQ